MGVKVREKRPGEFWIFVNHHGKRISKKIGKDKGEAKEVAEKLKAKLVLGDFGFEEKKELPTLSQAETTELFSTLAAKRPFAKDPAGRPFEDMQGCSSENIVAIASALLQ